MFLIPLAFLAGTVGMPEEDPPSTEPKEGQEARDPPSEAPTGADGLDPLEQALSKLVDETAEGSDTAVPQEPDGDTEGTPPTPPDPSEPAPSEPAPSDTVPLEPAPSAAAPSDPALPADAEDLRATLARVQAELELAMKEREAAVGDAEQLARDSREVSTRLAKAEAEFERERELRMEELEEERRARVQAEQDLSSTRQELERNLGELSQHRDGAGELERFRAGWEKAESDLRDREAALARELEEKQRESDARAKAETEAEAARAEAARLTEDLQESRAHTEKLQGELESALREVSELRSQPPPAPPAPAPAPAEAPAPAAPAAPASPSAAPRVLPSIPVIFLGPDGRSVAKQAFFAVGKGEALEAFLTLLLGQWKSSKLPVLSTGGPEGLLLQLRGDPYRRSLRLLPSGTLQVQLSPPELKEVQDLPTLVTRKRTGTANP